MKIKITRRTIETILWLLGQLITLMKQVSKDNKGSELGELFEKTADAFMDARAGVLILKNDFILKNNYIMKNKKMKKDNEQEKDKQNTKGN